MFCNWVLANLRFPHKEKTDNSKADWFNNLKMITLKSQWRAQKKDKPLKPFCVDQENAF